MTNANYFTQMAALNAAGPNAFVEPDEVEEVYLCSICETEHDDMEDAADCCKPDVYTRYRCGVCRDLHRTEEKAEKCHAMVHDNSQPKQCPICLKSAETYQVAADCHLHTHPTMTAHGRSLVAEAVEAGMSWVDAIAAHADH